MGMVSTVGSSKTVADVMGCLVRNYHRVTVVWNESDTAPFRIIATGFRGSGEEPNGWSINGVQFSGFFDPMAHQLMCEHFDAS